MEKLPAQDAAVPAAAAQKPAANKFQEILAIRIKK
jgi:hypothetical protein